MTNVAVWDMFVSPLIVCWPDLWQIENALIIWYLWNSWCSGEVGGWAREERKLLITSCPLARSRYPPTHMHLHWLNVPSFTSIQFRKRFCQERWENWFRSFNPIPTFQDQLLQKTQSDFLEVGWAGADCLIEPSWDEDKKAAVDIISSSSQEQVAHPKNI